MTTVAPAQIPQQPTAQTGDVPAPDAFQSRPFAEQPLQPQHHGPDLATQLATAQQAGHHFGNIPVFPPTPSHTHDALGDHAAEEMGEGSQPANDTGLPIPLKAGVESMSGMLMDDVTVHYNSPKPAQFQALAYTHGTNIHLGPGQEKHLPHEAWHVVQQKQGRVQPTMQLKDAQINDNSSLEHEADVMGTTADRGAPSVQPGNLAGRASASHAPNAGLRQQSVASNAPIQFIGFESEAFEPELDGKLEVDTNSNIADIGGKEINVFDGSVKVTDAENDAEAQEWEAGIIQTVYDSYQTDTYKADNGTYWRKTLEVRGATRDGIEVAPWYGHHTPFERNDDTKPTFMTDNPGGTPKLEITDKGKLIESTRHENFIMWQVACKTDHQNDRDNVVFLKHLPWQFGYRVTYDLENDQKAEVEGGITKENVGDGKGNTDPNLWDTPITLNQERIDRNTNWEEVKQASDQKYTNEINTIQQAEEKAEQKQDGNQPTNEPQNHPESEVKDESLTNEPQNHPESDVDDEVKGNPQVNEPQNQLGSDVNDEVGDETKDEQPANVLLGQVNYFQNGQELAQNQIEWFYQEWTGDLGVLAELYALSPYQQQQLLAYNQRQQQQWQQQQWQQQQWQQQQWQQQQLSYEDAPAEVDYSSLSRVELMSRLARGDEVARQELRGRFNMDI